MTRKLKRKRDAAIEDARDSIEQLKPKSDKPRRKVKHVIGDTLMGCITRAMQVLIVAFVIMISVSIVTTVVLPISATFIVDSNGLSAESTTVAMVAMFYAPFAFVCLLSFVGTCVLIRASYKWSGNMVKDAREAYERRQERNIWTKEVN